MGCPTDYMLQRWTAEISLETWVRMFDVYFTTAYLKFVIFARICFRLIGMVWQNCRKVLANTSLPKISRPMIGTILVAMISTKENMINNRPENGDIKSHKRLAWSNRSIHRDLPHLCISLRRCLSSRPTRPVRRMHYSRSSLVPISSHDNLSVLLSSPFRHLPTPRPAASTDPC